MSTVGHFLYIPDIIRVPAFQEIAAYAQAVAEPALKCL